MEWRSGKEKPTMEGVYQCLVKSEGGGIGTRVYKYDANSLSWTSSDRVIAWLDPEVPEEFLKLENKEEKQKPRWVKIDDLNLTQGSDWYWATSYACPPTTFYLHEDSKENLTFKDYLFWSVPISKPKEWEEK